MIIGITGTIGAGKDTISQYLVQEYNFEHFSVREFINKEIIRRNLPITRENMRIVANDLRSKYGAEYIVMQLYNKALQTNNNCIIESIRTTGEVATLKGKPSFQLWAIDAPIEVRYQRILKRNEYTDHISFEDFKQAEEKETGNNDPNQQNLAECMRMADKVFINDKSIPELQDEIQRTLVPLLE